MRRIPLAKRLHGRQTRRSPSQCIVGAPDRPINNHFNCCSTVSLPVAQIGPGRNRCLWSNHRDTCCVRARLSTRSPPRPSIRSLRGTYWGFRADARFGRGEGHATSPPPLPSVLLQRPSISGYPAARLTAPAYRHAPAWRTCRMPSRRGIARTRVCGGPAGPPPAATMHRSGDVRAPVGPGPHVHLRRGFP